MRKVVSILAIALLTVGFYSCEADTDVQDTEATFKQLKVDQSATDGDGTINDGRGNG
ncbi:hypothetical protein [Flagellimonas sediminis]|uniref:Uncharacterized protein n=1 Tax=Flagellimonas sediminis TaxID=2696468 RepID=A0A6I5L5B6_9FLAO|nr:hypothetical protein [Allomuricauda sediminis]NDV44080.1 hypothetical protein [Allomuricauda sediminis]